MCTGAGADVALDLVPTFSIHFESLEEATVFFVGPSTLVELVFSCSITLRIRVIFIVILIVFDRCLSCNRQHFPLFFQLLLVVSHTLNQLPFIGHSHIQIMTSQLVGFHFQLAKRCACLKFSGPCPHPYATCFITQLTILMKLHRYFAVYAHCHCIHSSQRRDQRLLRFCAH